jgi:hypothetical protein
MPEIEKLEVFEEFNQKVEQYKQLQYAIIYDDDDDY